MMINSRTVSIVLMLAGFLLAPATASAAPAPAPACRVALKADVDRASFAGTGRSFTNERLSRIGLATAARFNSVATRLCLAKVVKPRELAAIRTLLVLNGEGATEPLLYRQPQADPRALMLQYQFADDLAPSAAAIDHALRCWVKPQRAGCEAD